MEQRGIRNGDDHGSDPSPEELKRLARLVASRYPQFKGVEDWRFDLFGTEFRRNDCGDTGVAVGSIRRRQANTRAERKRYSHPDPIEDLTTSSNDDESTGHPEGVQYNSQTLDISEDEELRISSSAGPRSDAESIFDSDSDGNEIVPVRACRNVKKRRRIVNSDSSACEQEEAETENVANDTDDDGEEEEDITKILLSTTRNLVEIGATDHGEECIILDGPTTADDGNDEASEGVVVSTENDWLVDRDTTSSNEGDYGINEDGGDDFIDEESSEEVVAREDFQLELSRIRRSKLSLTLQGFKQKRQQWLGRYDHCCDDEDSNTEDVLTEAYDPTSVVYDNRTFHKGRCYRYHETVGNQTIEAIVGIIHFLPNNAANCKFIVPFEETLLGIEDGEFKADYKPSSHVQIYEEIPPLPLRNFNTESTEVTTIPKLIYEPQTEGSWQHFAYFYDTQPVRRGRRESLGVIELFAGCGGMHLGFKSAGFKAVKLVENDMSAVETLTANNDCTPIFPGNVRDFLRKYMDTSTKEELHQLKKDGSHLHTSPPCQGFSGANRNGGQNDRANNDLSLTFVDGVKLLQPPTASFENVMGMWRRKHVHYLKYIVAGLMKLGYQVRCCPLKACDYGDPQKRERLFIFASRKGIPLPRAPTKTHGKERGLLPYVMVKDTLVIYQHLSDAEKAKIPNISGRSTSLKVGQHGLVQLDSDGLAPAVRAKSVPPIHYDEDRCINVREAAALQSFPSTYIFCGKLQEQYQQVGNAVPVELASAVAQSIRQSTMFYYDE